MVIMIILLILCLPLILMLSLFTASSVVSIAVDVPVSGIDVMIEELVELDLDQNESFTVDYIVYPTEASNKDVSISFSAIGDEKLADFTVDGNTITPTSAGQARVTVETASGGYRDSFDVIVRTKGVESIASTPEKTVITVGETTKINTEFYPKAVKDESLSYRVKDGEGIVAVSKSGIVQGIGVGTATVEVASVDNPAAKSEFTITVESSGVIDFVSNTTYLTTQQSAGTLASVINPLITVEAYSAELFDAEGAPLGSDIIFVEFDTLTGVISYEFTDPAFVGRVEVRLTVSVADGESVTKSCYIERISDISAEWIDAALDGAVPVPRSLSDGIRFAIDLKPLGADVSYRIKLGYDARTNTAGGLRSGEAVNIEENTVYTAEGGYVSVELESSSQGVFLVVRGVYAYDSLSDIDKTLTTVSITVVDDTNGEEIQLDEISVQVFNY